MVKKVEKDDISKKYEEMIQVYRNTVAGLAKAHINKLNLIEERLERVVRALDTKLLTFNKIKKVVDQRLKEYASKMDSLEDSFFTLYHNIKKNQWIYMQDPEDWWNDYNDLKRHYKEALEDEQA